MLPHREESDKSYIRPAALRETASELHAESHDDPSGKEHKSGGEAVQTNYRTSTLTALEICNEERGTAKLASKDAEKQEVECRVEEPSTDLTLQKDATEEVRSAIQKHRIYSI